MSTVWDLGMTESAWLSPLQFCNCSDGSMLLKGSIVHLQSSFFPYIQQGSTTGREPRRVCFLLTGVWRDNLGVIVLINAILF